jgi:hypothetical protein
MAFCPIESPSPCRLPLALVIFPFATVICTCTGPYCVLSVGPVKVPDGFAGAVVEGAFGGAFGGAELDGALLGGAVVGVVLAGVGDAFGAVFFAGLAGRALVAGADAVGDGGADTDSPAGVLDAATGVTPGTWVLNENSAARPATVPLRVRTARRMQPPGAKWLPGSGRRRDGG